MLDIRCGDSAKLLQQIPNKSIDLIVTSPPYFQQRTYGKNGVGNEKSVEKYIDSMMTIFHECVRITKNTGSIVFNIGDKYEHGSLLLVPYLFAIRALRDEKIKLVNNITWVKTNPTPRQFKRRLVSSTEPFFHFVKTDEYYYNLESFKLQEKQNKETSSPKRTNVGNKYKGLITNSSLTKSQKILAFKELDKVIQETKQGNITGFRMKIKDIHSLPFGGQEGGRLTQIKKNGFTIIKLHGKPMKKDIILSPVESLKWNKHTAIYPESIISNIMHLLTSPNSTVLDPFLGSGTSGVSAKKLGRNFIGIDINSEYCQMATKRIKDTTL